MKDCKTSLHSIKIKTVFVATFIAFVLSLISFHYLEEQHDFHFVSDKSVINQKTCIEKVLKVFQRLQIPLVLFDFDILTYIFQPKSKSWHKSNHNCKALCKFHPDEMNVISFAMEGSRLHGDQENLLWSDLDNTGFSIHITHTPNPWSTPKKGSQNLPTHVWLAYQNHIIHIAILHERVHKYVWSKDISEKDWTEAVTKLAGELTENWKDLKSLGLHLPTHEQVFDKKSIFPGMAMAIDGHLLTIPYNVKKLIDEHLTSIFIQCDKQHAKRYKAQYGKDLSTEERGFRKNATSVLYKANEVFDMLNIPFWLTGETLLGYMQQCDVLRDGVNVQLGIWAKDFSMDIISNLESQGLRLAHLFGRHSDSLELTLVSTNGVVLDIHVFYKETDCVWNGATRAHDGKKYIFKYKHFGLCWTEFLDLKVRIPCQTVEYVSSYYGSNWMAPLTSWVWNLDPHNIETNGRWSNQEMEEVIKVFSVSEENYSNEEITEALVHLETNPEFHYLNDERKRIKFQEYMSSKHNKNKLEILEIPKSNTADL